MESIKRGLNCLVVGGLDADLLAPLQQQANLDLYRAAGTEEALRLLRSQRIALALIDLDGSEERLALAEQIRAAHDGDLVPMIFLADESLDLERVLERARAVDVLFKPVDPRLLATKAQLFIELHLQRLRLAEQVDLLRTSEERLHETQRLTETFVAAISHDLRNPLNVLSLACGILLRKVNDPEELRLIERIRASGKRMTSLIDELYDLARVRLGSGFVLSPREVDVETLANSVISDVQASFGKREIRLEVEGPATGSYDPSRLSRVLANLVGNAARHGQADRPVMVRIGGGPDQLEVKVWNGGSIPPEVQAVVFEPFRSGARGSSDGLGLGLYIVREIVRAHGGSIELSSSPEDGTTFVVRLPRRAGPPAEQRADEGPMARLLQRRVP
jgi:signal transduction histidine kinase